MVCVPALVAVVTISMWAADARGQVAYSALRDGRWTIHVQDTIQQPPRRLGSALMADAGGVALQASGKRLSFETTDGRVLLCGFADVDDCSVLAQDDGQLGRPAWFPRGEDLVLVTFQVRPTGEDSDLVRRENGELRPLLTQTGVQEDPDVHPNGQIIAYTSAQTVSLRRAGVQIVQHLWVADLSTGHARPLIPSDARDTQPDWSPSGAQLAFASNRSGQFEIWVVDADGRNPRMVTAGSGTKTAPAWSPDGKAIMFTMVTEGRYALWIIGADGKSLRMFQPFGNGSTVELRDADWR